MDVVLAVLTSSPYRDSVTRFADDFADSIKGRVRVAAPVQVGAVADAPTATIGAEALEPLLDRVEAEAEHDVEAIAPQMLVNGEWLIGPLVRECVRAMARCDFGVVGRTLGGELPEGQTLGRQVVELKRSCTRPLIIVPREVRPLRTALFVYTNHPEAGHALSLAQPLSATGKNIRLFVATPELGRSELEGAGSAYLEEHGVPHRTVKYDCSRCDVEGGGAGPAGDILRLVDQEDIDLVVMGGTRRGFFGQMLWPEMAYEVAYNINVPLLIWY
jgi:nucleotide-binding universal stress UspA family protein